MGYRSTRECVLDLERSGQLLRVETEIDPNLEIAEIQRRLYERGGPAVLFERVKGSPFPAVSNLFGTIERARYVFHDTIESVRRVIELKADPANFRRNPFRYWQAPLTAVRALPKRVSGGPVFAGRCALSQLPAIKSWPDDGGPFITLPQVYSEDPNQPELMHSNLGMYRVQLGGNDYEAEREVGLHYQIHRGIGVHHRAAIERGEKLPVSVFVGGSPAHTLAAVMPLPEGLSELVFAGMLAGRRFRAARRGQNTIAAEADFCLVGHIDPKRTKPEGPFGDHLGYYSLQHDFPVMEVEAVYHRRDAIWPFTVVGRPPQEDTTFGQLIHELTAPMVPQSIPGLRSMHAVDAAGVHPLLLAIGSERYRPYADDSAPQELLTIANAILGFNQASLAKYLLIVDEADDRKLDIESVDAFLSHLLSRVDWRRDLHFQTRTTIDTLDYSGTGLNAGSKVVIAARGEPKRELATHSPAQLPLPAGFSGPALALPGILLVEGPAFGTAAEGERSMQTLASALATLPDDAMEGWPLVVVVDELPFCAQKTSNFLWVCFTRSNPANDIYGVHSFTEHKHWGCRGSLLIDARIKEHHAPPLVEDPAITRRVDELAAPGGPFHGQW